MAITRISMASFRPVALASVATPPALVLTAEEAQLVQSMRCLPDGIQRVLYGTVQSQAEYYREVRRPQLHAVGRSPLPGARSNP
jgi:hypothetical protein